MRLSSFIFFMFIRAAVFGFGAASRLGAQTVSLQVGATSFGEFRQPEVGVRVSPRGRTILGAEFSFDAYPNFLLAGAFVGMADLTLVGRVQLAPALAIIGRGGASVFLAGAGEGGALETGVCGGAGIVVTVDPRTSLRLDYTYRRLQVDGGPSTAPSLTFGFVVHH